MNSIKNLNFKNFFFLILLCFLFSSCNKQEKIKKVKQNLLSGVWTFDKDMTNEMNSSMSEKMKLTTDTIGDELEKIKLRFNDDHMGVQSMTRASTMDIVGVGEKYIEVLYPNNSKIKYNVEGDRVWFYPKSDSNYKAYLKKIAN